MIRQGDERIGQDGLIISVVMRTVTCLVAVLALLPLCLAAHAEERPRRVLMLHAYNYTFPSTTRMGDAARKRLLSSGRKFEIDTEFLDLARIVNPEHEARIADFVRQKYRGTPPDVVMTLGGASMPFMLRHRETISPGIPVVFTTITQQDYSETSSIPNATAITSEFDLGKTLDLAERLQPEARKLFIIAGTGALDQRWQAVAREAVRGRRFETTFLFGLPYQSLISELRKVPRDAIVCILTVFADGTGKQFIPADAVAELSSLSPAPVYGFYDTYLGKGIVGGYVETFESIGVAAADLILEMFSKDSVTLPAPRINPLQGYRVDFAAMQRWGLSESRLPPGSVIVNRPPNIWDQHRNLVLAALAVIALQTTLVVFLLIQRRQRRVAEAEAALQRQEVAHLMRVSVLGELSGAIAHEINQPLAAVQSNAETGLDLLAGRAPDLAEIRAILEDIAHDNRRAGEVVLRLRNLLKKGERKPESIDIDELVRSTVALLNSELISRGTSIDLSIGRSFPPLSGDPVQLQQVLLNLIMNAMDAMAATPASQRLVTISADVTSAGAIELSVKDRGSGLRQGEEEKLFTPFYTTKARGLGLGLSICSTIVEAHGGKLSLFNAPDGGAIARLSLPGQTMLKAAE